MRFASLTLAAALAGLALPGTVARGELAELIFEPKLLAVDTNEGCAVGDIDGDGRLDISAGRNWYRNDDFAPRNLRDLAPYGEDYLQNCSEHLLDVDGDGRLDVVSMGFAESTLHWYRNPGGEALALGLPWEKRLLVDTGNPNSNEVTLLADIDGDGEVELLVNTGAADRPLVAWKFDRGSQVPRLLKQVIGPQFNGHGIGFGDLSGDGRADLLVGSGWYRGPAAADQPWIFEPWNLPQASCPMIVRNVDGDGRADILWGNGHGYGLYLERQLEPGPDGRLQFERQVIDASFSQAHCLVMADLDGDGEEELITGKRVRAHSGRNPGANDEPKLFAYNFRSGTWVRRVISATGVGTGLQIRVADLDGDGRSDLVVAGKKGTWVLFNRTAMRTGG